MKSTFMPVILRGSFLEDKLIFKREYGLSESVFMVVSCLVVVVVVGI